MQLLLDRDADCTIWTQGFFDLSENTLDALIKSLDEWDFGIFVFSADDVLKLREHTYAAPRDNVVLEFGLFAGRLGKARALMIHPRNWEPKLRIPTDLLGITSATYDSSRTDGNAALGPACTEIRRHLAKVYLPRPGVYMNNQFMCGIGAGWHSYTSKTGSVAFDRDCVRIDGTADVGFEVPNFKLSGPANYVLFRVQRLTDIPLHLYVAFHSRGSVTHVSASTNLNDFGWDSPTNEFRVPLTGIPVKEWYPVTLALSGLHDSLNSSTTTLTFKMRAPLEVSHILCTDDLKHVPPLLRTVRGRAITPVTIPQNYTAVAILAPSNGATVGRQEIVAGVAADPSRRIRLYVQADGKWYPQKHPHRDGRIWKGTCVFGNECTQPGEKFKLAAISCSETDPEPDLNDDAPFSQDHSCEISVIGKGDPTAFPKSDRPTAHDLANLNVPQQFGLGRPRLQFRGGQNADFVKVAIPSRANGFKLTVVLPEETYWRCGFILAPEDYIRDGRRDIEITEYFLFHLFQGNPGVAGSPPEPTGVAFNGYCRKTGLLRVPSPLVSITCANRADIIVGFTNDRRHVTIASATGDLLQARVDPTYFENLYLVAWADRYPPVDVTVIVDFT